MKKFIAILLSMLMLCAMLPFATVAAAGEYTVEIVADAEEVNAGDEVTIEVSLYGHESVGLIGALVELGFDSNVFELETYYDEDEEMWMPPIEVGPKFSASSNKYIMFSPIDEETGAMERCLVKFVRATATATQAVKTNLFYTVTFKVKDDAPSGDYTIDFIGYNQKNIILHGNQVVDWTWEPVTIHVNGSEPEVPSCEHEYTYACDKVCAKCGELTNPDADHTIVAVDAKAPTCTELGNIAYWYCSDCGSAWSDEALTLVTNQMAVKLGATCATNAVYTAAKDATCFEPGNVEYWYCANCDVYYADAACTIITNAKNVIIPITHNVIHVAAKDATCTEMGNIEYWYCDICGSAWLDEYCTLNTNLKAVILPMAEHRWSNLVVTPSTCYEAGYITITCGDCGKVAVSGVDAEADQYLIDYPFFNLDPSHKNIVAVEAKAATCTENGNIAYWYCADCGQAWLDEACTLNTNLKAVVLPMADHTYASDCDTTCDACGAEREVILPAAPIAFGGNSISENKNGLAFLFTADVDGIVIGENYIADYNNATVIINGEEHKLVGMGAIVNNKGYAEQTLENVDGQYVLNVEAAKVFDASSYAIRIINIPAENLDTTITARSYLTYECGGELITIYGEDIATSYNAELG